MNKKIEAGPLDRILSGLRLEPEEASVVEEIMREEIFHSTLDWQGEEQLLGAAIQAHDRFRREEAFYLAASRHARAGFELEHLRAIDAEAEALSQAVRKEEAARCELNRYLEYSLPAIS